MYDINKHTINFTLPKCFDFLKYEYKIQGYCYFQYKRITVNVDGQSVVEDVRYDRAKKIAILNVPGSDDGRKKVCTSSNLHDMNKVSISVISIIHNTALSTRNLHYQGTTYKENVPSYNEVHPTQHS